MTLGHYRMPCGPRIATFFFYLADVDEGGGTDFDRVAKTVQPKRGRAVLWYNIYPDTQAMDSRTHHEALPVIKGEKWGINKWLHTRPFY